MLFFLSVLTELSDKDLVSRARTGDQQAFSKLMRRYQDRIFSLTLRWIGDRQIAEETTQEVFIAVYRSLDRFRGESSFSTWLYRVAINHCKNKKIYRRRRAADKHEPLEGKKDPDDDSPDRQHPSHLETDTQTHQSEAQVIVHQALEALSDEQRQIIILRDIQDLDYDEIAELLELPRGTVKSRLHRARNELAKILRNRISQEDVKL